jgi:hypothetical protein
VTRSTRHLQPTLPQAALAFAALRVLDPSGLHANLLDQRRCKALREADPEDRGARLWEADLLAEECLIRGGVKR